MPRLLASMIRFSIWSLMPRPCRPPMALASRNSATGSANGLAVQRHRLALHKAHGRRFSALTAQSSRQNGTPMMGLTILMPLSRLLKILGLMGRAQHVAVGRIGLFGAHLVAEAIGGHERRHFGAAAQFVDELLVEPGLVDLEAAGWSAGRNGRSARYRCL